MKFTETIGHEKVKGRLIRAFEKDRIPSAYLFLGDQGIGKSTLVKEFATKINCDSQEGCHGCENCKLFHRQAHPDFIIIKPSGQNIRIAQIQELIGQLGLKPAYAKKRVVFVQNAERMNPESANAFLKILEEPPLDTLIILETSEENLLLETIISRCQKISFSPLEKQHLEGIYQKAFKIKEAEKRFLLNYAGGRVRKDFIEQVSVLNTMRKQVLTLLTNQSSEAQMDHFKWVEQWLKKDLYPYFFEFCCQWLKDFIYLQDGQSERIVNNDMIDELQAVERSFTREQLLWSFDLTVETEIAVKMNAGRQLAIEALLIQYKQVFSGMLVV